MNVDQSINQSMTCHCPTEIDCGCLLKSHSPCLRPMDKLRLRLICGTIADAVGEDESGRSLRVDCVKDDDKEDDPG